MRLLIRLYPRAWRNRYEHEFLATVEDRDPSLRDLADIVLGAIDAHLTEWRRRVQGEIFDLLYRRSSPTRLAASLLMIAGVLLLSPLVVAHVAVLAASAQFPTVIGLISPALSCVAALALLSQRPLERVSRTRGVGLAMVSVSACMTLVTVAVAVLFTSSAPAWLPVALLLSFNAGWSLFGIAETRRGVLPRSAPLAVGLAGAQGTVGPCLVLVLTVLHGGGSATGVGWALMANPLLAAAWVLLALALWSTSGKVEHATPA